MVNYSNTREKLEQLLRQRIVIIDGAMGTTLQRYQLDEAAYRGERFKDWAQELKGKAQKNFGKAEERLGDND